jgi:tryptophan-rich sensory protein
MTGPSASKKTGAMVPAWGFRSLRALAVLLVICFLAAAIGGAVTTPKIDGWYATLTKPSFNPPNWIFGPVWTILYAMMAFAAWRVWRTDPAIVANRRALLLFMLQLVFNLAWSTAFFGVENPLAGLVVIVLLEILIVATILAFGKQDKTAAWLLVPYAAWVGFAMLLNIAIYRLN